jgi:hypothetical protein
MKNLVGFTAEQHIREGQALLSAEYDGGEHGPQTAYDGSSPARELLYREATAHFAAAQAITAARQQGFLFGTGDNVGTPENPEGRA